MLALIVDDHPMVREGLSNTLRASQPAFQVTSAESAAQALTWLHQQAFDVVIMDINLPDGSGLDVLKALRRFNTTLPVLVLSMHTEDSLALCALRLGANGYLTKDATPAQLLSVISRIIGGELHFSASVMRQLVAEVPQADQKPAHESLSDREYQVMCRLASGNAITRIAGDLRLSPNTVSTYRTRIFEKLGLHNNAALTRYALDHKLID